MTEKLPIYSIVPEVNDKRKKKFSNEVGTIYAKLKKMTKEEYFHIKAEFDAGDSTALDKLMDNSVYFIVEDVIEVFAKYDIENVLDIEDVLSVCLSEFNRYIHTFTTLPEMYSKYTNSVIQQYVFFKVVRQYVLETRRTKNLDIMNDAQLAVAVDMDRYYIMEDIGTNKEEFYKILNKILKDYSKRQEIMVKMYFNDEDPKTLNQIAEEFNLTQGRVAQLLRNIMERIRRHKKINKLELFRDAQFKDEIGFGF